MRKLGMFAAVALGLGIMVPLLQATGGQPKLGFDPQTFIVRSDGSGLRAVTSGAGWKSHPAWSRKGDRLAFIRRGIGVFSLATGKVRRLPHARQTGAASINWSPRREEFVYWYGSGTEDRPRGHVALLKTDGGGFKRLTTWTGGTAGKGDPAWSPDGNSVTYAREWARRDPPSGPDPYCICGPTNVAIVSRAGADAQFRLKGDELHPVWSPDSKWILFARQPERGGSFGLWKITARGHRLQRVGPSIVHAVAPLSWSPDGTRVAFTGHSDTGTRDQALFVLDAAPAGAPRLIAEHVGGSAWSPTDDLIAFTNFSGEVRLTAPEGSGQRTLAKFPSETEFRYLTWSRDGKQLAFVAVKQRPSD